MSVDKSLPAQGSGFVFEEDTLSSAAFTFLQNLSIRMGFAFAPYDWTDLLIICVQIMFFVDDNGNEVLCLGSMVKVS